MHTSVTLWFGVILPLVSVHINTENGVDPYVDLWLDVVLIVIYGYPVSAQSHPVLWKI